MTDFPLGQTIDVKFTSRRFTTGVPYTLAGSPAVAAYPDNSTTEITAGITLSVDFDSRVGLNSVRIVATTGNGYAAGVSYALVITAGTIDSVSVVGEVVGQFTIERGAAYVAASIVPTATQNADALLKRDMSAVTGEAARSPLNAIRKLMNKWSIAGATLTVCKEDDTTAAYTQTVGTTPGADPVSSLDTV